MLTAGTELDELARVMREASNAWLIEAPFGYRAGRLLDAIDTAGPCRRIGPDDVGALLAEPLPAPVSGVVDVFPDVDQWPVETHTRLCELLEHRHRPPYPVITAKRCPDQVTERLRAMTATVVGVKHLRVGSSVAKGRLERAGAADTAQAEIADLVDGWPLLLDRIVDWLLRHRDSAADLARIDVTHAVVASCVHDSLALLGTEDRDACEQLAHLDSFDSTLADTVSPGLLERLQSAGVPCELDAQGRYRFVRAVSKSMRLARGLDPRMALRLIDTMVRTGNGLAAAALAARIGHSELTAEIITAMTPEAMSTADPHELVQLIGMVETAAAGHPRLLLIAARAHGQLNEVQAQRLQIDRAVALTGVHHEEVRREAEVEQLYLDARAGTDVAQLESRIGKLRTQATDPRSRARLQEAEGLVLAQSSDETQLERSLDLQRRATATWKALGEPLLATTALRGQVKTVHMPLGQYGDALAAIDEALKLAPVLSVDRVRSLVILTQVLAATGRDERNAEITEAAALARSLGWGWAEAYVAWSAMTLAGLHGNADLVDRLGDQVWEMLGPLQQHETGAVLLSERAEATYLAGDVARADELAAAARERGTECARELMFAELAGASVRGDVQAFEAVIDRRNDVGVSPRMAWRLDMYRARLARHTEVSSRHLERSAMAGAADCGAQRVVELVLGTAPAAREIKAEEAPRPTVPAGDGRRAVRMTTLGPFAVSVDGRPVRLPGTKVRKFLEVLAVAGEPLPVEVVLDRLWPDASEATARKRLKNVVARSRSLVGDVIERSPRTIGLAGTVYVDLAEFLRASGAAARQLAENDPSATPSAIRSLGLYRGPLVADDPYDAYLEATRRSVMNRALSLFDSILAHADVDTLAPLLIHSLLAIDSDDAIRFAALGEWCRRRGLNNTATQMARRVDEINAKIGIA